MSLLLKSWVGGIGGGGQSWESYFSTRTPTGLVLTVLSDTSVKVDWTDAAAAADGLKIYFDNVLKDTVAFGVGTSTVTVVLNTEYTIKIVAYKGINESDPLTGNLTWSHWMQYSYTDKINTHATWTSAQKALILGRLQEDYVVTTFGPTGANKADCDFFIYFDTWVGLHASSRIDKTGASLRWNYGAGNIYTQNYLPSQISTTEITVTSTDGFGSVTRITINGQFRNNIPNLPYYFPNVTNLTMGGGTISSGTRLKGDITSWGFWKSTMIGYQLPQNDLTGDLTGWIVPDTLWSINFAGCRFLTGAIPAYQATWAGSTATAVDYSGCNFHAIAGTAFPYTKAFTPNYSGNLFSTAEITNFIDRLDTWYAAHPPTANGTINISGAYSGTITGGDANTDLINLKATFVTAGFTFTPTYNVDTYLLTPLDKPTLVVGMDDDAMSDYTVVKPEFDARGIIGVSYRYGLWVAGHQTITEVNALIAAGWDIEAHPGFAAGDDEADIRAEMVSIQNFFTANSIPMFNHCSYQSGYYNALVQSIIGDYCDTARGVMNYNDSPVLANRGGLIYKDSDPTWIPSITCDPITDDVVAGTKLLLDKAKIKSAGITIYFHGITPADFAKILEIVDYAIAQGFDIVGIDDLYAKMIS